MALLNAGPCIIERLKDRCLSVSGNVFSAADLAGVAEKTQIAPALHVVLQGYTPGDDDGAGAVRWDETYLVVAVVKHAARKDRPQAQQEEAAPIVKDVLAALSGWRLPAKSQVNSKLKLVPGPRPHFSETHAYFPLAFQVQPKTGGVEEDA
ncbi:MAG: hypothetical protein C0466_07655 [Candidatus Accumulibacter sp.]|nr:hypothetical protein [Accumulibacter sp.]